MSAETEQPETDLDVVFPSEQKIDVMGIECRVQRIRTRHLLLIMRMLVNAFGGNINKLRMDTESETFLSEMLGLMMVVIPEAMDEFSQFLAAIVTPVDGEQTARVRAVMMDPPPVVLVDVLTAVMEQEQDDLAVIMGKVLALTNTTKTLMAKQNSTNGKQAVAARVSRSRKSST